MSRSLTICGAGGFARSMAPQFERVGYPVTLVYARRRHAATKLAASLKDADATTSLRRVARCPSILSLAVADDAIAEIAQTLSAIPDVDWSGRTVLHHAGSLGPEPLRCLRKLGASIGVFHPLQSLRDPRLTRELLRGARARIDGDDGAVSIARRWARALGMEPLTLAADADPVVYHAAAALVANDWGALVSVAIELLESCGLSEIDARQALTPLARGVLAHLEKHPAREAFTGAATRGDRKTLAAHTRRLERHSPDAAKIHRELSRLLARISGQGI